MNHISLLELNTKIKQTLHTSFAEGIWIIAEISELKTNKSGHCYIELIQKDEYNTNIVAKSRAVIWSYTYKMLKPYFETSTNQQLTTGIKILVKVLVEFHEAYGFSLNIRDIDPNYTLGDIAAKKLEIINRLKQDGVFHMNKELDFPSIPKNIAIISSDTAAGFEDFINQLENNNYGFRFHYKLFQTIMQGEKTEESVIASIERIFEFETIFDVVVIIRGGGSKADLSWFDNYNITSYLAQLPIPVISGIGHDRDESIVDLIANKSVKTPTAAAELLINSFLDFNATTNEYQSYFITKVKESINEEKNRLNNLSYKYSPIVKEVLSEEKSNLNLLKSQLKNINERFILNKNRKLSELNNSINNKAKQICIKEKALLNEYKLKLKNRSIRYLNANKHKLALFENTNNLLNPQNILKKGYSLTLLNGKVIKDSKQLKNNDKIETQLSKGKIKSVVTK